MGRKKIIYNKGDKLGPYKIKFIKEINPYIEPNGKKRRKAIFKCPYCGEYFEARIEGIKNGSPKSCRTCFKKLNIELAKKNGRKKDLVGQKFGHLTVIKETPKRGHNGEIVWECQCDCDNSKVVLVKTNHLTSGHTQSCGCHKESRGEEKIRLFLRSLNINFKTQKTFNKCKNPKTGYKLKFDFYLSDYNCCIEFDGEQHFKEATFCNDTLKDRQYRDNLKTQYCKDNNIKLIRIPYWDFDNIEDILTKELNL